MSKNNLYPAIRFKEFTNAWEQEKLGDNGEFKSSSVDKVIRKNDYLVFLLNFMDVYKGIEINKKNLKINTANKGQINSFNILKSDVFFTPSSETRNDIGIAKTSIETIYHGVFSYHLIRYRLKNKVFYDFFIDYIVKTHKYRTLFYKEAVGVQRFVLSMKTFNNLKVSKPKMAEQKKIVQLLKTIDNLITLHQRKLKALENIKKTLLDKMFPDEKSNIPSIRFKEFTNAWEQEKLRNVASVINGKSNSNNAVKNGQYPFYIRSKEILRSNKFLFDEEAVITIGEGNIGKVFHFVKGKFDLHQRCYKIYNFNSYIFAKFFYYYFSQHFYKRAISDSSKATVDSIRLETITGMNIKFSQLIDEQIKISKLLDSLNNLITLHQRKIKKLENIKKTLLEKMFV